jgi:hypothetical protein
MGWKAGVRFPGGERESSFLYSVQTGSGTHPGSYPMDTRGGFPGVKRQEHETDHLPPSSTEVKNGGAISPLLYTSSWRGA